jgi:hypothetical protein
MWDSNNGTCIGCLGSASFGLNNIFINDLEKEKIGSEKKKKNNNNNNIITTGSNGVGVGFGGHSHWVNTMSLSSDYLLRLGPYNESGEKEDDGDVEEAKRKQNEYLVRSEERRVGKEC